MTPRTREGLPTSLKVVLGAFAGGVASAIYVVWRELLR